MAEPAEPHLPSSEQLAVLEARVSSLERHLGDGNGSDLATDGNLLSAISQLGSKVASMKTAALVECDSFYRLMEADLGAVPSMNGATTDNGSVDWMWELIRSREELLGATARGLEAVSRLETVGLPLDRPMRPNLADKRRLASVTETHASQLQGTAVIMERCDSILSEYRAAMDELSKRLHCWDELLSCCEAMADELVQGRDLPK
eukprot:jgi/Mesvir1/3827/Mv19795-RA.1